MSRPVVIVHSCCLQLSDDSDGWNLTPYPKAPFTLCTDRRVSAPLRSQCEVGLNGP